MSALFGAVTVDISRAADSEDAMYKAKVAAQEVAPNDHKRSPAGTTQRAH
jgi:hypothetical protein